VLKIIIDLSAYFVNFWSMDKIKNEMDYNFPITKRYEDDEDGRRRNKSIEIFDSEEWSDDIEQWVYGYRVAAQHENWTGAEWLCITNSEFTTLFDEAVNIAKEMQSELYE
tara:strand:- start:2981 stop:3310 length:330 start_codon:yes stop_codon:yes gene_type:complete